MELEERVTRLEEEVFFQGKQVQDLDAALKIVNQDFEQLQRKFDGLKQEIEKMYDLITLPHTRPPHSAPEQFQIQDLKK